MTQNLLLFSIGSTTWGVGDGDVSAVIAARPLHRLPLSPPSIAGMALIEDKPVSVFDLGACLGEPPLAAPEKGSFLLIAREGRTFAFAVAGKVDRMDGAGDRIVPLPVPACSPVVESCLVRAESIVPVIGLQKLLERVKLGNLDIPAPLPPAATERQVPPIPSSVFLLSLGGEAFGIDAADSDYREGGPEEILPLPYAPLLAGVLAQGQDIVPVISLAAQIGLENKHAERGMIVTELDGMRWGLPVDGAEGRRENISVLELPPLARPAWSRAALVEDGKVIPIIDGRTIGSATSGPRDQDHLAQQYQPASAFPLRFRQGGVEVIELSLFGARHAVPKEEVAEVLPFLPVRRLTQVSEIVLGVSELNGKLLPVLDLEAVFGRRSVVTPGWKMLRITNGDFDALVVMETVFGTKELPPEMQRQVPIAIPHQVLYGCYLDSSAVRLILNVEALAVHFEKTEIREFITGMSPAVPTVPEVPQKEEGPIAAAGPPVQDDPTSQLRAAEEPAPAEMHGGGDAYKYPGAGAGSRWHVPRADADKESAEKARETAAEEERRRIEEEEKKRAEREELERAEAEGRVKAEEEARRKAAEEERRRLEEDARLRAEKESRERAEAEARAKAEEEARQKAAEDERRRAEEAARQAAEREKGERLEREAREKAEEDARRREAEEVLRRTEADAEARRRSEERLRQVMQEELRARESAREGAVAASPDRVSNIWWVVAAVVVLAVVALLVRGPGKAPEQRTPTVAPAPAARDAAVKKEPEAPLYLNVPRSMPKPETVIYVVVKGDTLWGIAKRFTGDPFNYPRVARDNSIATPDLIFPGQKIKLIQKER